MAALRDKKMTSLHKIAHAGIIAQLPDNLPTQRLWEIADSLLASPILAVLVPFDPAAPTISYELVQDLRRRANRHMLVGLGQVPTVAVAAEAMVAGAQFISSDKWHKGVQALCADHQLLYLPQVISQIGARLLAEAGCSCVLLRTGGSHGADYVQSLAAQLPDLTIVVAADADATQLAGYRQAGATAVLVTTALFHAPDQPMADLISRARRLQAAWAATGD